MLQLLHSIVFHTRCSSTSFCKTKLCLNVSFINFPLDKRSITSCIFPVQGGPECAKDGGKKKAKGAAGESAGRAEVSY